MSQTLPDLDALLAHGDFVRALARSLVADPDRADDVVQQTWMASIERPPISGLPARAWLASVVRNAARRFVRSDRRRRRAEDSLPPRPPAPSTADVVAREAIRAAVVRAVIDLTEPYREVVLLRYFEGLPPRAIARQLQLPVETVRTRLKRAQALLREHLDREYDERAGWVLAVLPLTRLSSPAGLLGASFPYIIIAAATLAGILAAVLHWGMLPMWDRSEPVRIDGSTTVTSSRVTAQPPTDAAPAPLVPAATPTLGRPTVTGTVVDRGGRSVVGASVRSFPVTATSLFETTGAGIPFTDSTRSDGDGRFTIALDPTSPFGAVFVEKSGFSPAALGELRSGDDVIVTLDSPRSLTGTVRDGDDRPVPGARVRWRTALLLCRIERTGQTDASGTFRLEGLPASEPAQALGDTWAIDVDADGFAPLHVEADRSRSHEPPAEHLDFVVGAGATIAGRVLDDGSGKAIAGAAVSLYSVEGDPTAVSRDTGFVVVEPSFGRKLASAVSGADGAFRIEHVPARGFHDPVCFLQNDDGSLIGYLRVDAPGVSNRVFPVHVADEGATVTLDLRCVRAATVVGRVVDGRGRPVAGATVCAVDRLSDPLGLWGSNPRGTTAADDGRYTLERVAASDRVSVHAWLGPSNARGNADVVAPAGAVVEAPDIVFGSPLVAELVVVDADGRPIWGAVAVSGFHMGGENRSDEHGRLRLYFPHASGTSPRRVTVRAPGFATTLSPELSPSAESPPEVRVVLESAHRISGRVVDAAGLGMSRALVTVSFEHSAVPLGTDSLQLKLASTRTGDDGTFEFRDLPSGPYRVHVEWQPPVHVNHLPPALETDLEFVATNSTGLVIALPAQDAAGVETATLEGTVRDAITRRPVLRFGALVDLGTNAIWAKRVGPGRFRFDEVPLGEGYRVRVIAEGYAPWDRADVDVHPAGERSDRIDVLLERGATVSGTVGGLAANELRGHRFTLRFKGAGSSSFQEFRVGRDGRYEATGVPPGRYRPLVTSPSLSWQTFVPDSNDEVEVLDVSSPVRFDFDVVHAGALTIVLDSSLSPESARWEIRDASGATRRERSTSDESRSWQLDLPPGDYVVRLDWGDGRPLRRDVHVVAGKREEIWLQRR